MAHLSNKPNHSKSELLLKMNKNTFMSAASPLRREHMPRDFSISLDRYIGREGFGGGFQDSEKRIPADFGPGQSMRGFEETYRNIIDYIVRITYRIWEDRDVEYILETYADRSQVFDDYGLQKGSRKIVADTHHTTGAFSNIQLIADEVIWAGDDEIGFHTSHRTLIRGTNDGDSKYGPASSKNVDVLVIANCVAKDNVIFLEHVLYNNSSLLQQLGLGVDEMAKQMSANPPPGWPRDEATWKALRHSARPAQAIHLAQPIDGFDVDRFSRELLDELWNGKNYDALSRHYSKNFAFEGATGRRFTGRQDYVLMLKELAGAFPDLQLEVDEVYWMGNDRDGYLSSERWSASGTHLGAGRYGSPTGCEVQIWGITQHQIIEGRIVREWMLFNELDLMMQIAAARQ
jgi:predicted ester cyclase